jgi:hypothetical protein
MMFLSSDNGNNWIEFKNGLRNMNISPCSLLSAGNYLMVAKGNSNFTSSKLVICK